MMAQYITYIGLMIRVQCVVLLFFACRGEPSLPLPSPINEAIIQGMDTLYMIELGETLSIIPEIRFTQDVTQDDASRYRYEWIFLVQPSIGGQFDYRTISTEKALMSYSIADDIRPVTGAFDFLFRVRDSYTDTFTEFPFRVIVGNAYYEGWMVLNSINGIGRVDMLSYHPPTASFRHLPNVIRFPTNSSQMPEQPVFIHHSMILEEETNFGNVCVVGTDRDMYACSDDDLKIGFHYYRKYFAGYTISPIEKAKSKFYTFYYNQYLLVGGMAFQHYESDLTDRSFEQINKRVVQDNRIIPFRTAPWLAMNSKNAFDIAILFDEDADEFVWHNYAHEPYCIPLTFVNQFDRQRDWALVYLGYTAYEGGQYRGVLRDTATGMFYFIRFKSDRLLEFSEISATNEWEKMQQVAMHPYTGNMYFSINRSLYEFNGKITRKLTDFDGEITLLKFNAFLSLMDYVTGPSVNKDRYETYERMLLVACHHAGRPDDSGSFMLYDMVNHRVFQQFSGFGRIADVTYKEQ